MEQRLPERRRFPDVEPAAREGGHAARVAGFQWQAADLHADVDSDG